MCESVDARDPERADEVGGGCTDRADRPPVGHLAEVDVPGREKTVEQEDERHHYAGDRAGSYRLPAIEAAPQPPDEPAEGRDDDHGCEHRESVDDAELVEQQVQRVVQHEAEARHGQRGVPRPLILPAGRQHRDYNGDTRRQSGGDHRPQGRIVQPAGQGDEDQDRRRSDCRNKECRQSPSSTTADNTHPHDSGEERQHDYRWSAHPRIGKEVVEPDRAELLQHDRDPEDRKREEEERDECDGVVEGRVLAEGGHDTECHTDDDADQQRPCDELQGGSGGGAEELGDVLAIDRVAEVELADECSEHAARPDEVSQVGGEVEIQQFDALLDEGRLIREAALSQVREGIAGRRGQDVDEVGGDQQHGE